MKNRKFIVEESCFECPHGVAVKDYGDEFDPWWGFDAVELTIEDIEALLKGKVLETSCNGEYGILIRMERADDTEQAKGGGADG